MGGNSENKKSKLNMLHSGEKVLCDNCEEGFYEAVDGGEVILGYKCNKCGNFIHITPGNILVE